MRVLFHNNQLDERGTTVALYDYAHYNETILGNLSYIAVPSDATSLIAFEKFNERFPGRVLVYATDATTRKMVQVWKIDTTYYIRAGFEQPFPTWDLTGNVVHAVFNVNQPHGNRYAYVSEWLGEENNAPFVPHIVHLPEMRGDYRSFLNIPEDALVFGRYGGYDQFDVPYLSHVIEYILSVNPKAYFLLMNTRGLNFVDERVIFMGATTDVYVKRCFLNTLDAFLHGRTEGESFGLSIAEACFANLPVITNRICRDKNHFRILGDQGYYYGSASELIAILRDFKRKEYDYTQLVKPFAPEPVMQQFKRVFLD